MDLPEALDIPPEDAEQRRDQPAFVSCSPNGSPDNVDACAHREEYVG